VGRLAAAVENQTMERLRSTISAAFASSETRQKPATRTSQASHAGEAAPKVRKVRLGPEALAARRLQGQYLGLLRGLQPGPRAQVKKVAREQGVAAAIKFSTTLE